MTGEVATGRYFVYHNPHELRASDSYLERQFHTEYTYKSGDRDRRTYEPDERRAQFAFPEMHAQDPANALDRFISSVFGATAIAAGEQSRFEAQVKYYRESREPRCVTISSVLQPSDNGKLQISLSDLDFPRETQPFDTGSYSWVINWRTPQAQR